MYPESHQSPPNEQSNPNAKQLLTFIGNQNIYPIATMLLGDICFFPKLTDTSIILGKRLEFALIYSGQNKYLDFISYLKLI